MFHVSYLVSFHKYNYLCVLSSWVTLMGEQLVKVNIRKTRSPHGKLNIQQFLNAQHTGRTPLPLSRLSRADDPYLGGSCPS